MKVHALGTDRVFLHNGEPLTGKDLHYQRISKEVTRPGSRDPG